MRCKRILSLILTGVPAVVLLQAQTISPDEIRVGSQQYTPQPKGHFKVQANLVEVGVVVRDAKGQTVSGLKQNEFQILDNDRPQTTTAFSEETASARESENSSTPAPMPTGELPGPVAPAAAPPARYVVLFFDDRSMPQGDLIPSREAARKFIAESLKTGDHVALFTSSLAVKQEFTQDVQKLQDAIAQLQPRQRLAELGGGSCPRIGPFQAYLIVNNADPRAHDLALEQAVQCNCRRPDPVCRSGQDRIVQMQASMTLSLADNFSQATLGVLQEVIQYLAKMRGRRLLVLASSGFLTVSLTVKQRQDSLISAALHGGVVVNSLDAKGLVADTRAGNLSDGPPIVLAGRPDLTAYGTSLASAQREAANDPLAILSEGTGGRFFHNNNDLSQGIRELAAAPEASYLLGFSPGDLKPDGNFHKLKVKLDRPGHFDVQARRGYYAPTKDAPAQLTPRERLDASVLATDAIADFTTQLTTRSEKLESGETVLRTVIHVDARNLPFIKQGDRHVEKLRIVIALFDLEGNYLAGLEAGVDLALKDETLAKISREGLDERASLKVAPGSYRLRMVAQELVQGRMAALSIPVEIP